MALLSIKVPKELGYDNYFTGEDAGRSEVNSQ
jgi:hypothetical protein